MSEATLSCRPCGRVLPADAFNLDRRRTTGRQTCCRECKRAADKRLYHGNAGRRASIRLASADRLARQRELVAEARQGRCVRCGFADARALDFHHVDPATKRFSVANIGVHRPSDARLLAEIAKCELLCANCHRITHAERTETRADEGPRTLKPLDYESGALPLSYVGEQPSNSHRRNARVLSAESTER